METYATESTLDQADALRIISDKARALSLFVMDAEGMTPSHLVGLSAILTDMALELECLADRAEDAA